MSTAREEIQILMESILVTARTNPLPRFDPEALATVLLHDLEGIWHLMSVESKIAMTLIAVTLQHRQNGAVATRPGLLARWLRPFRAREARKGPGRA
ncbi:hypothetical protein ACEN88_00435 [Massilia sp. CT11-108]|uniref:hypothetical protein n=1 Tax=Massilia sp. CT11-108 TaxID=3393900 RepID=UPI0039A55C97